MNLFSKRYLAFFCAVFAVVSLGGCFIYARQKLILVGLLWGLTAVPAFLFLRRSKKRASVLKCALCFLFAALSLTSSYLAIDCKRERLSPFFGQTSEVEITVVGKNNVSDVFSSFDVLVEFGGKQYNAALECEYKGDFSVGDVLRGTVDIVRIEERQDSASYYFARGIYLSFVSTEDTFSVTDTGYSNLRIKMRALNSLLSRVYEYTIGADAADLIAAVSLGNKKALAAEILRDFRRIGLSHVLAISGMHISVIMTAIEWLLRRLGLRKSIRCVLIFCIALFYLALTGFSLSTVRAFMMMSFVYLAFLLRNDNDPITSLFFALFAILLFTPTAVWDVGLWMSFLAVLGIFVAQYFIQAVSDRLYKATKRRLLIKPALYLLSAIMITIFANIFVCLPLWLYFGEFSTVSILANLIISPLVSFLLSSAPVFLLVYLTPVLSFLVPHMTTVLREVADLTLSLASRISDWEHITVSLRYPFAGYIIVPTFVLLLLALILPLRRKIWIPAIPLAAALLFSGCFLYHNHQYSEQLTVDYLSRGESEMILMTSADEAVICDMSTGGNSHLYQAILLSRERFSTEISAVILTHYHAYHINTFSRNAASAKIRTLYLPMPQTLDEYQLMCSLIDIAEKRLVDVVIYDRGKELSPIEDVSFYLSELTYLKRSTHPTFTLSISAFDKTVTYIAESAHDSVDLQNQANAQVQQSDYVILGTHGPITQTDFSYDVSPTAQIFVSDTNVLSHFDPRAHESVVIGSSAVSIRLQKEK